MRRIGIIPSQTQAQVFSDYLIARGFDNQVDPEPEGWGIWVLDDDHLEAAGAELNNFLANPDHASFRQIAPAAAEIRRQQEKKQALRHKLYTDVRTTWNDAPARHRPFTLALIALCLLATVLSGMGETDNPTTQMLRFKPVILETKNYEGYTYQVPAETDPESLDKRNRRAELSSIIDQHQYWRLITPIFLHLSWLHLIFNLFWMHDFASLIESRKGSFKFLLLVFFSAAFSNLAQFYFDGPGFGGFSGVNYALFGFIWMRGKYRPQEKLLLHKNTIQIMLAWLLICMTGLVGNIANSAHLFGLLFGIACGYAPVFLARARNRPRP